ncbi:MAG: FAD-binding oxidoreductase [Bryobacteraceae bacterium]|nr:FAD-binding oxidoreductase [Bryobacteraceae bacterium]
MDIVRPASPEELSACLRKAAEAGQRIRLGGAFSKDGMAGPCVAEGLCISTTGLSRVLQYEPKDLTIQVQAGMRWADLKALLASNGQMIPLDPPFGDRATVGGVAASNSSGPRRRLFGTARDLVIGMTFATLEGKLVSSGGMVVKNVAGLDISKLMIGSFGTLAAMTSVNFRLTPTPTAWRTFVLRFDDPDSLMAARNTVLGSVLLPATIDALNPAGSDRVGLRGYCLLLEAGGHPAVLDRYERELANAAVLRQDDADRLWTAVREFVPRFLAEFPGGAVLRHSTTLSGIADLLRKQTEPALSRAGNGVTWVCIEDAANARATKGSVVEWAPEPVKRSMDLWPDAGSGFGVMKKVKMMFDPKELLNPGRLYGRL